MKRVVSWSETHSSFYFSIYVTIPMDCCKNQFNLMFSLSISIFLVVLNYVFTLSFYHELLENSG